MLVIGIVYTTPYALLVVLFICGYAKWKKKETGLYPYAISLVVGTGMYLFLMGVKVQESGGIPESRGTSYTVFEMSLAAIAYVLAIRLWVHGGMKEVRLKKVKSIDGR